MQWHSDFLTVVKVSRLCFQRARHETPICDTCGHNCFDHTKREICLLKISLQWKELCRVIHSLLAPHWESNIEGRDSEATLQRFIHLFHFRRILFNPLTIVSLHNHSRSAFSETSSHLEQPTALPSADKSQHFTTSAIIWAFTSQCDTRIYSNGRECAINLNKENSPQLRVTQETYQMSSSNSDEKLTFAQ